MIPQKNPPPAQITGSLTAKSAGKYAEAMRRQRVNRDIASIRRNIKSYGTAALMAYSRRKDFPEEFRELCRTVAELKTASVRKTNAAAPPRAVKPAAPRVIVHRVLGKVGRAPSRFDAAIGHDAWRVEQIAATVKAVGVPMPSPDEYASLADARAYRAKLTAWAQRELSRDEAHVLTQYALHRLKAKAAKK